MLRRTFAKTLLFSCAIPCWPFKQIRQKLDNSKLIARLLKERKKFSITCDDGEKFNIIPNTKRTIDIKAALKRRLNMSPAEKEKQDNNGWPRPKVIRSLYTEHPELFCKVKPFHKHHDK